METKPVSSTVSTASEISDLATLRKDISDLAESAKQLAVEQIGGRVEDAQQNLEARIRRNPTQAMLFASGIGFVFGLILAR